jgi:signal peptidase
MKNLAGGIVWLRRIVDIALIALIVIVLAGVALGKLVPLTGRQTLVIGGGSMAPALPLGSAVVIGPADPASLKPGDVVSLKAGERNSIFTHRVITVLDRPDGRWIRTKGDANADPDPTLIPATDVIGRVEIALPLMGYLLALLSLPVGVVFVVGLAATLLAIAWLLESLEPAPILARPSTLATQPGPAPRDTTPAPVPAWFVRGEPIAARTLVATGPTATGPLLMPVIGRMAAQLVAPGTRTPLVADPAAAPRPTAREQIARSHELRTRRWRFRDRGPHATA